MEICVEVGLADEAVGILFTTAEAVAKILNPLVGR